MSGYQYVIAVLVAFALLAIALAIWDLIHARRDWRRYTALKAAVDRILAEERQGGDPR